jgi:hypothetical protein
VFALRAVLAAMTLPSVGRLYRFSYDAGSKTIIRTLSLGRALSFKNLHVLSRIMRQ